MLRTMLRFVSARDLFAVFKSFTVSHVARSQVKRIFLPQSGMVLHKVHFFTRSPCRKDVLLPNPTCASDDEPKTIDLDKWKAVMKMKAFPEENVQVGDADENEEGTNLTLESTRELVTMWRLAGRAIPQEINDEELQTLADLTTKSARKKYLKYLAIREGHKRSRKEKQQKKKAEKEALFKERSKGQGDEVDSDEKEMKNSLILQFWSRSLDKLLAWRCAQAMVFGQSLVFDLSYEANMSKREVENTVSQLLEVEAWNRRATDPFHLHFCNLQPDSYYKQQLIKRFGSEAWDRLLITSTDKQHFELFPRQKLVYLTADSPNVLRTYDHNKVYIIGGLVDRSAQSGLSLANAKRLKLATARLPLTEYLHWGVGAKNLTLDQMIRILLTLKDTGEWTKALEFVPTRKHDGFHPHQQKETKTVKNKYKTESGSILLKDTKVNNINTRAMFNKPKTVKTKTATKNRSFWSDE